MRRFALGFYLLAAVSMAAASDTNALDKRVNAIAKSIHLTSRQTTTLMQCTHDFESELDLLLERYPSTRARQPFTQALVARFRNKIRGIMSPAQFARLEALERA